MEEAPGKRRPSIAHDANFVAADSPVLVGDIDLLGQQEWSKENSAVVFKAALLDIVDNGADSHSQAQS